MGRILRKKPPGLKKKKKPEADRPGAEGAAVAGEPSGAAVAAEENRGRAPAPVKKAIPPAAPAAPPADTFYHRAVQYLREVKIELKKVTWPSRKQTMGSTLVVLILVMLISVFLGMVDMGLSTLVRAVFR